MVRVMHPRGLLTTVLPAGAVEVGALGGTGAGVGAAGGETGGVVTTGAGEEGAGVQGSLYPPVPVEGGAVVVEAAELFVGVVTVGAGEGDVLDGVGEGFTDGLAEAVTVFVTVTLGVGLAEGFVAGFADDFTEGVAAALVRAGFLGAEGVVAVFEGASAEVGGVATGRREGGAVVSVGSGRAGGGVQLEAVVVGDGFSSVAKGSA